VTLDLVVLGGGITGLGIARLAARQGWSVALFERDDLASGASSASSHMLHGGVRYLEHGQFALVREALSERTAVARMAPALARPVRFLVPLLRGGRVPGWKLRAGLTLYDVLAGRERLSGHTMARAPEALALEPGLASDGLTGAGLYSDMVMDDARLAIAVARDAHAHGATIRTRCELQAVRPASEPRGALELTVRDREARAEERLTARVVVNATGAWSDRTRRDLLRSLWPGRPDPPPRLRPSRGIHLVYPALTRGHGVLLTAASDGRAFFVVPFAGRSLVGTTEVATQSPPADAEWAPTIEEIRYLAAEVARVLPAAAHVAPLAVCAGVRPLLDAGADVGRASREHRVIEDGALLTIAGGKYTTFRVMARDVIAAAARQLERDPARVADSVAPLPPPVAADVDANALGAHAVEHEFARTLADVLRRRSTHWLDDHHGLAVAPAIAGALARRLGWSPERERDELDQWRLHVRDEQALLARALVVH